MTVLYRHVLMFFLIARISSGSLLTKQLSNAFRGLPIGFPIAVAGSALAIEAYSRIPQKLLFGSNPRPLESFKETDVVLIFPGAGGPDENTENLAKAIIESDKSCGIKRHVEVYDWSPWRGSLIRASFDGQSVGKIIGKQLATEYKNIKSLHVMGVSVGAFAADSCSFTYQKALKDNKRNVKGQDPSASTFAPYVRVTLLDPFTQRGLFGTKYGGKFFGKAANFCEHYLNTDDPVPSTNDPIGTAIVYDITSSAARKEFIPLEGDSMHSWPVAFYGRKWRTELNKDGSLYHPVHSKDSLRGAVVSVP